MGSFNAFVAAGPPLSQSPIDKGTPEEKLQAEITRLRKEVKEAEEDPRELHILSCHCAQRVLP
jgi:hypothetical protein